MIALVVAFAATGAAWLANAGTSSLNIQVDTGVQNNGGQAVALTALSGISFTRPNGNAQLVAGLAFERVTAASTYGNNMGFDVQWLDPQDASRVLSNPNTQIYFGFYYPIYTGSCSGNNNSVTATLATITDNSQTFCAQLDTNATGSPVLDGKLLLSGTELGGHLQTAVSDSGATTACTSSGSTWCLPSGLGNASGTEVGYLAATIQTPGGKPQGQQTDLSSLSFYFASSRH